MMSAFSRKGNHSPATRSTLVAVAGSASISHAAPSIFWASDPVNPGESVMAIGDGFGDKPTVEVEVVRLSDSVPALPTDKPFAWSGKGRSAEVLQADDGCVKFQLPPSLSEGIVAYRVSTQEGSAVGLLNRPVVWWAQGNLGVSASPGGWIRAFGRNLQVGKGATGAFLKGAQTVALKAEADCFAAKVALPKDLPAGEYQLHLHNGSGGDLMWSRSVTVRVEIPKPWPQKVLNVMDFGAAGTGDKDDTAAVQAACARAEADGGGIVYFPRGRYQLTQTLEIPQQALLKGERRDLVSLFWPDVQDALPAQINGSHSFGIEDISFYCSNYSRFLVAEDKQPTAGNVHLRRILVRADRYRGHPKPEEVDRRLRTGGGNQCPLLTLGGGNVEITDCDLYSSGMVFWLSRLQGALIANNDLTNGRWGWYSLSGSNGVIFENNHITGGDLMATGGGLNCLDGSNYSQFIYYAHNTLTNMFGWDREAMTSDAGGGAYFGKVASAKDTTVTLAEEPNLQGRDWRGAGLYILDGKGSGQYRRVVSANGHNVVVEYPWQVNPDTTSTVTVCAYQGRCLFIGNDFTDAGAALQFYGNALEHICSGNRSTRTAGFHNFGMQYSNGIQPNWYLQWLDNEILEGNVYRGDHDNWRLSGEAHIGVYAFPPNSNWDCPLTLGTVVRRNQLHNNAHIMLGCEWNGGGFERAGRYVRDVLVENNAISNSDLGIFTYATAHGVLLRGNQFHNVTQPVLEAATLMKEDDERRLKYLGKPEPMAVWDFDKVTNDAKGTLLKAVDVTGNGFDANAYGVQIVEGMKGRAGKFSGDSHLRVNDPVPFNLQDVTVLLWIKPERVKGRQGLLGKRFSGSAAPFVLSLWDGGLEFEATDEKGQWSFNFRTSAVIKEGQWNCVAFVAEAGKGVTLYCNGEKVGHKDDVLKRAFNMEPLVIGREAWSGEPNVHNPCYFQGLMDEMKIWARALTDDEIRKESKRG